jgi:hypothetical protein
MMKHTQSCKHGEARIAGVVLAGLMLVTANDVSGQEKMTPKDVNLVRLAEDGGARQASASPRTNEPPPSIRLQWKDPVQVARLVLKGKADPRNDRRGGKVLFSDGSFLDLDEVPPQGRPYEVRFPSRTVTWLRLDLFSARGSAIDQSEIEVYADDGAPTKPAATRPTPGTWVTIEEKDPRITAVDGVGEGRVWGAMWCPFAGTSVMLIANTGPASGMADIYIDGVYQKTADWYSEKAASNTTVFAAENLADGKHLLGVLTRGGTKHAESKGTSINWSRIEYLAGEHPERFVPVKYTRFDSNVPLWLDDRGEQIQGHMGGIMHHDGKYYMVGGDWLGKPIPRFIPFWIKNEGLRIYSSPDLLNWTYCSTFCRPSSDPAHILYDYTVGAGRPKLIRAKGTGKFVVLFQVVDFSTVNATAAAVADKPEGPYQWHGLLQYDDKPLAGSDTAVFTDDDGTQYLVTGRPGSNISDCLYELTPDCLHVKKAKVLGTAGESPALFKHDGIYYFLHSGLTTLDANENFYHTATNIWGPWESKGGIAKGPNSGATFRTQTMDVVPVAGKKDDFVFIGDSIRGNLFGNTRSVWLPVTLKAKGEMEIRWRDWWSRLPQITAQPADLSVIEGQAATFRVTATGSEFGEPNFYQWYKNDGAIPGATGTWCTAPGAMLNDRGAAFKVAVTNANGAVTSSVARLKVYPSTLTVKSAGGRVVAMGGTVTNYMLNGTNFTAHIFTSSGTFSVTAGGNVAALLVGGGGGGGGGWQGGGGGAGALRFWSGPMEGVYEITVGEGGNGCLIAGATAIASDGMPSSMIGPGVGVSAVGGGRGASEAPTAAAGNGGSGGGGSWGGGETGGAGTSGEGNAGGNSSNNFMIPQGGGGGAGSAGLSGSQGGTGGVGVVVNFSGVPVTFAAGGNGSARRASACAHAAANTGNGGHAGGNVGNGDRGGSGIVIVRYVTGGK